MTQGGNARSAFRQRQGISPFRGGARGHRPGMPGEPPIRLEIAVRVVEWSIDGFPREPASAPLSDDAQDGVGVPPLAALPSWVVSSPVPLRPVVGFPHRRRLRGLRRPRARAPEASPRSGGAERVEHDVGAPFIPVTRCASDRLPSRGYEPRKGTGARLAASPIDAVALSVPLTPLASRGQAV